MEQRKGTSNLLPARRSLSYLLVSFLIFGFMVGQQGGTVALPTQSMKQQVRLRGRRSQRSASVDAAMMHSVQGRDILHAITSQQQTQRDLSSGASMWENSDAQYHIKHQLAVPDARGPTITETTDAVEEKDQVTTQKVKVLPGAKEEKSQPVGPMKEEPKGLYVEEKAATRAKQKGTSKIKGAKNTNSYEEEEVNQLPVSEESSIDEDGPLLPQENTSKPPATKGNKEDKNDGNLAGEPPATKDGNKGDTKFSRASSSTNSPTTLLTEIKLGFEYKMTSDVEPTNEDYAELAKTTSQLFDFHFRSYFLDEDSVAFLSTDRLAIYEVKAPNYVIFTIGSYFDGDFSLPSDQQLTDISVVGMKEGTSTYEYYLHLLQQMNPSNPFQSVTHVSLYSQYSALTGPVGLETTDRNAHSVFRVIVPIVVLLVASVVVAMIYMNWVESHSLLATEEESRHRTATQRRGSNKTKRKRKNDHRRRLHQRIQMNRSVATDGEGTLASDCERSTFKDFDNDNDTTTSESSARFVEDSGPRRNEKTRQVRVSPRVLYRTFAPGEFATRMDFEEVSLYDYEEDNSVTHRDRETCVKKLTAAGEISITEVMDNFAQVLNSTSFHDKKPSPEDDVTARSSSNIVDADEQKQTDSDDASAQLVPDSMTLLVNANGVVSTEDGAVKLDSEYVDPDLDLGISEAGLDNRERYETTTIDEERPESTYNAELVDCQASNTPDPQVELDDDYEEEEVEEIEEEMEYEEEVIEYEEEEGVTFSTETRKGNGESEEQDNGEEEERRKTKGYQSLVAVGSPESSDGTGPTELAGGKLRDFWEKKSTKQPSNLRDFWEQQSKRK